MIVISQNNFLFLGILVFIFIKACIYSEHKKKSVLGCSFKKTYRFDDFIYDLFLIYLIGVASKIYFPLNIAWGQEVRYMFPSIWLRPLWSLKEIYNSGGINSLIYQVSGNLIILTPMAFFLCYFNQSSYLYPEGKRIIFFINKFWRNEFSINFSKVLKLKDIIKICFVISLFMETSQFFLSLIVPNTKRFFEINDIIFNTLSGIWGYHLFYMFVKIRKSILEFLHKYKDKIYDYL